MVIHGLQGCSYALWVSTEGLVAVAIGVCLAPLGSPEDQIDLGLTRYDARLVGAAAIPQGRGKILTRTLAETLTSRLTLGPIMLSR